jgi:DNA-binding transcriptional ArsR family regulator
MRSHRLRRVVEHPVRLAILACLDGELLTLSQVSARIGRDEKHVAYHVKLLDSSGLVEAAGDGEEGGNLYVARRKHQPCWVARAVNEHRLGNRRAGGRGGRR